MKYYNLSIGLIQCYTSGYPYAIQLCSNVYPHYIRVPIPRTDIKFEGYFLARKYGKVDKWYPADEAPKILIDMLKKHMPAEQITMCAQGVLSNTTKPWTLNFYRQILTLIQ